MVNTIIRLQPGDQTDTGSEYVAAPSACDFDATYFATHILRHSLHLVLSLRTFCLCLTSPLMQSTGISIILNHLIKWL
jgi:hypothetical protein